jgi:hypothetical protein
MNRKILTHTVLLLLAMVWLGACKKKQESFLGPEYAAAPAGFSVVNNDMKGYVRLPSGDTSSIIGNVNLLQRATFFKASFSHKVSWTLTMTSAKTNAVRVFKGLSDFIDSTNTIWKGESSNDYFFGFLGSGTSNRDSIEAVLTFLGSSVEIRKKFSVSNNKKYHNATYNGVDYYMIDDFDGTNPTTAFSSFYIDQQDVGGGNTGNNAYGLIKNQGNFSYRMYGRDVNNNTYLGSCNTPTLNDIPANTIKSTDPAQVYINMYIYGTGKPNTTVSIISFENDREMLYQTFDQTQNDKYICQIEVTWEGWKLVSVPYSRFKRTNTGAGLGNNRLDPDRICGLALELDSYPNPGFEVEAMIDMVVLTVGGVFQK